MSANRHAHRVPTKRDEAAHFLIDWLEGVAGTFRNHVAEHREMLCEHCSAEELIVRMRADDMVKLADRLDSVATVIRAGAFTEKQKSNDDHHA